MNSFLIALQFLTIIPTPYTYHATDKQLGNSTLFYPLIGFLIGGTLVLAALCLSALPLQIQATLIVTLWVMLTGALHIDGLADCADAWVGGLGSQQRSLEIMKDPASGPVAVTTLILLLLLKWSTIAYIIEQQSLIILLFAPLLGRLSILILMLFANYIRKDGLGYQLIQFLPVSVVQKIVFICIFTSAYIIGALPIMLMLSLCWLIRHQSNKRLGGVTGDVYGASVELVETSVLLGFIL